MGALARCINASILLPTVPIKDWYKFMKAAIEKEDEDAKTR